MTMSRRFSHNEEGATMVEMTIAIVLLLTLTLGFVDFGYAYYQWNAATKAVQIGTRMASISHPVASEVASAGPATTPGAPMPSGTYDFVCTGGGACTPGTYVAANFDRIFGGDDGACATPLVGRPGMCDFFPRLRPNNVVVRYTATGLGYQTRPGGAVPTITVSLQNVTFQFFFLSGLLGFNNITMPSMLSTVTGEDLKSSYP
jgi:Flp pilus assembly protein TadG